MPDAAITASRSVTSTGKPPVRLTASAYSTANVDNSPIGEYFLNITSYQLFFKIILAAENISSTIPAKVRANIAMHKGKGSETSLQIRSPSIAAAVPAAIINIGVLLFLHNISISMPIISGSE